MQYNIVSCVLVKYQREIGFVSLKLNKASFFIGMMRLRGNKLSRSIEIKHVGLCFDLTREISLHCYRLILFTHLLHILSNGCYPLCSSDL